MQIYFVTYYLSTLEMFSLHFEFQTYFYFNGYLFKCHRLNPSPSRVFQISLCTLNKCNSLVCFYVLTSVLTTNLTLRMLMLYLDRLDYVQITGNLSPAVWMDFLEDVSVLQIYLPPYSDAHFKYVILCSISCQNMFLLIEELAFPPQLYPASWDMGTWHSMTLCILWIIQPLSQYMTRQI